MWATSNLMDAGSWQKVTDAIPSFSGGYWTVVIPLPATPVSFYRIVATNSPQEGGGARWFAPRCMVFTGRPLQHLEMAAGGENEDE